MIQGEIAGALSVMSGEVLTTRRRMDRTGHPTALVSLYSTLTDYICKDTTLATCQDWLVTRLILWIYLSVPISVATPN